MLYSGHVFDFGADIGSITPFLRDLTDVGRGCVKKVALMKRSLLNTRSFDRCEWAAACEYISQHLSLERLDLDVIGTSTREGIASHYGGLAGLPEVSPRVLESNELFEWARQLASIKGLKEANVRAIYDNSYSVPSGVMELVAAFSPVIETDFARWLRDHMVCHHAEAMGSS